MNLRHAFLTLLALSLVAASPGKSKEVVFVLDATGSGRDGLSVAIKHIESLVADLPPTSAFTVFVQYDEDEPPSALFDSPRSPSKQNKEATHEFLAKVTAKGAGDGFHALLAAIDRRPGQVWYFSDGDGPDRERELREIERHAKDAHSQVNTTFEMRPAAPDSNESEIRGFLWEIARRTGGRCLDTAGAEVSKNPAGPHE